MCSEGGDSEVPSDQGQGVQLPEPASVDVRVSRFGRKIRPVQRLDL